MLTQNYLLFLLCVQDFEAIHQARSASAANASNGASAENGVVSANGGSNGVANGHSNGKGPSGRAASTIPDILGGGRGKGTQKMHGKHAAVSSCLKS